MAAKLSARSRRGNAISEINVTPLVDVVLVLLIVLMVTATAIASETIPMDLPSASTGEDSATVLAISVDPSGATYLDGQAIEARALAERVRQAPTDARATIAADRRVAHGQVVELMDLLRQNGVSRFAISVEPE